MKDAFEDFSTTPTLTFDPLPEEKEPEQPIPQEQEKPILDDSIQMCIRDSITAAAIFFFFVFNFIIIIHLFSFHTVK